MKIRTKAFLIPYTSSPFLFTDYPLYFFCLQFTAQTVIFDNVARDRYLTKDFNNGLGNEVSPNWRNRNTDSSSKLYLDISTIYHALMWHNSSAFLLPDMTFQKEFRLVTLIFKLIQISNRSGVEGSVLMTLKGKISLAMFICIIICWNDQNNNEQGLNSYPSWSCKRYSTLIFKLIQISFFNWSEAEGSVSHILELNLALYVHLHNRSLKCLIFTQQ